MAKIQLQNITKIYPRSRQSEAVTAVDDVSLTVLSGQTLAIVGPSGSGKSTLMRITAGLETAYNGEVIFDNRNMNGVKPKDRFIGMVFQNYALYPHFEGHGNLAFFFKMNYKPDKETEERIEITSKIMGFGFKELLKRKPGTLSGGQQQRLAIGRAIVRNPDLFLFDEPLSNLDARLRAKTRVEIRRLLRQFRITGIFVTHDQVEATTIGDQIAIMNQGRIEQAGSFRQLRESPANTFVAGFLGLPPMNLFPGGVIADTNLRLDQMTIPLPDAIKPHVQTNQPITLGIRPEDGYLAEDEQAPPNGIKLQGVAEVVEPDFPRDKQVIHLRSDNLTFALETGLKRRVLLEETLDVVFPPDHLYFFDEQSTQRIGQAPQPR